MSQSIRAHLEAIRDRVGDPHVRRSANLNYQDAVAAIALLDEAAKLMDTPTIGEPGVRDVRVYSGMRLVPDPVVSSIATRDGQPS